MHSPHPASPTPRPCLALAPPQVVVTGGNFADFEGKVLRSEGGRVTAELDIFGKRTTVDLSPGELSSGGGDVGGGGGGDDA